MAQKAIIGSSLNEPSDKVKKIEPIIPGLIVTDRNSHTVEKSKSIEESFADDIHDLYLEYLKRLTTVSLPITRLELPMPFLLGSISGTPRSLASIADLK